MHSQPTTQAVMVNQAYLVQIKASLRITKTRSTHSVTGFNLLSNCDQINQATKAPSNTPELDIKPALPPAPCAISFKAMGLVTQKVQIKFVKK